MRERSVISRPSTWRWGPLACLIVGLSFLPSCDRTGFFGVGAESDAKPLVFIPAEAYESPWSQFRETPASSIGDPNLHEFVSWSVVGQQPPEYLRIEVNRREMMLSRTDMKERNPSRVVYGSAQSNEHFPVGFRQMRESLLDSRGSRRSMSGYYVHVRVPHALSEDSSSPATVQGLPPEEGGTPSELDLPGAK